VRVIAATNRDLRAMMIEKTFREDLYYRLAMVELKTPSLAERREDLPLMTRHFLERFAAQYGKDIHGVTWRAQAVLARHSWPGNVRELENVIGSACMMAIGDTIDVADLPEYMRSGHPSSAATPIAAPADPGLDGLSLDDQERHLLAAALEKSGGNQSQAARLLRISRDRLRYKMAKFNLK
jgi:DNA-binding NtrC family response regulator